MRHKIYTLSLFAILLVVGTSCSDHTHEEGGHQHEEAGHDDHGNEEEAHDDHEEKEDEVHLLQKQMDVMDIQLGGFKSVNLSTTIKSNGRLELPPQNKASLSALIGGRVKSIAVKEGDAVRKGEIIAYLENPQFITMQREYFEAKSNYELLRIDFNRKAKLFEQKVTSAKEFQRVETAFKNAEAAYKATEATLTMLDVSMSANTGNILSALPVKSPISGFVRLVEINIGTYVEPQTEMFEIVDNDHIHIDLMVYEKDIDKISVDQKVVFSLATHAEKVFEGRVFAVGKAFERDTKAVKVHAEITSKPDGLLPGMFVDARIVTREAIAVQAVPNDAIIRESGLSYIFVRTNAEGHDAHEGHDHGDAHEGHDHGDAHAGHDHGEESHDEHDHEEESHEGHDHRDDAHSGHDHGDVAHEGHGHDDDHEGHAHAENGEHGEGEFTFKKIEVNTGATDIGFTEVVPAQWLPKNPEIVIKGAYYLQAEMKKGEGGHGHHH